MGSRGSKVKQMSEQLAQEMRATLEEMKGVKEDEWRVTSGERSGEKNSSR